MTTDLDPKYLEQRRDKWIGRVTQLLDQIADWAEQNDWAIQRDDKAITERLLGPYKVPTLVVKLEEGEELHVQPIGLHVIGAEGRVDLEAYPTLNRVKLVGRGPDWEIVTDSNVPLHAPWNAETFVQLAKDLLA